LRPQNNVGRNCFRISQIQQAFAQAYTELLHRGTAQASSETRKAGSVLGLMLYRC
jgi:DNA polymerase sigma